MTIKEYAQSSGVSYQSIAESFKRYCNKGVLIEGTHYVKVGRSVNILPPGVEVLNMYRRKAPAVVPDREQYSLQQEEVRRLREELQTLREEKDKQISELSLSLAQKTSELDLIKNELLDSYRQNAELSRLLLPQKETAPEVAENSPLPVEEKRSFWKRLFG